MNDTTRNETGIADTALSPIDALEIIESRNIVFNKILGAAIQSTSTSDWIDQGGKPYLQASGAEKVARRFGVKIFDVVIERESFEDDNGKYYVYTVMGKSALSGRDEIEAIGTCSSRDPFFGKSHGEYKAMADVDLGNIKKKAYTNFMGNAITRLLGIRNLSWEDLAKFGITKDGKTSVKYDGGASKAANSKKAEKNQSDSKKPYWPSEWQGKKYIFARVGKHFSLEILKSLGFKETKTEGILSRLHDLEVENTLEQEYEISEVASREEASNGTAA